MKERDPEFFLGDVFEECFDEAAQNLHDDSAIENPLCDSLQNLGERYQDPVLIGQGGMKRIYKVMDLKASRYVAMATLHDGSPKDFYDPFIREARLNALLEHPNIIKIYDIGLSKKGSPYFTMELKIGDSLDSILDHCKQQDSNYLQTYPLDRLLGIFLKIMDAVAYAHSRNIIHLDLKPANIQVGQFGEVLVCDWGLGKVIGKEDDLDWDQELLNPDLLNNMTMTGEIKGTPGYISPEQIKRDGIKDQRTDIYALGCILYTILCHHSPFHDMDSQALLKQVIESEIEDPIIRFPEKSIPSGLSSVVMKALSCSPEDRYQSVKEFQQEIVQYLRGYSTAAENASFLREANLFYKRNQSICNVITISLFAMLSVVSFFIYGLNQSRLAEMDARSEAENSLNLYLKEKEWAEQIVQQHVEGTQENVYFLADDLFFKDPVASINNKIEYLSAKIEEKPDALWAYRQRGFLFFLLQDLHQAKKDFRVSPPQTKMMMELTDRFSVKNKPGELLPVDDLILLLKNLPLKIKKDPMIAVMMILDGKCRESLQEHVEIIKSVIALQNPEWNEEFFQYDFEEKHLFLKSEKHLQLTAKMDYLRNSVAKHSTYGRDSIHILSTIHVESAKIESETPFYLASLSALSIKELDISEAVVQNLNSIRYLSYLEKLIIREDQYPVTEIKKIPKNITLGHL